MVDFQVKHFEVFDAIICQYNKQGQTVNGSEVIFKKGHTEKYIDNQKNIYTDKKTDRQEKRKKVYNMSHKKYLIMKTTLSVKTAIKNDF